MIDQTLATLNDDSIATQASKLEELQDVEPSKVQAAKDLVLEMANVIDANALYQRCFQLLKLGGLEAEIPRLVVFGQQSMGKTTLLGEGVEVFFKGVLLSIF